MLKNKPLLVALLIRLLLAPFFYHPDMKSQYFHFQFLGQGHFDIYSYIAKNKKALPYRDTFNYLPLTYFTFGIVDIFLKPILPADFPTWVNNWGGHQYDNPSFPFILLILKIPYLILDFAIAFLILKISQNRRYQLLWLFNPFSFYLIYILGNFDILPVFLTLLSYFLLKKKPAISFLIFGIAIALKLYPLMFLPFFLLAVNRNPLKFFKYIIITFIPVILTILPFASNRFFWASFFGSGLTQKIIELKFFSLPAFPIIYLFIFVIAYLSPKFNLPKFIFYIFLLFISTVHFHPQWLLWFLPFIFLLKNIFTSKNFIVFSILSILIFSYIFLFNDNYLTWGHLIPIDPEFIMLTSPYDFVRYHLLLDPLKIQNQLKSTIALFSLITFFFYEKNSTHPHS